MTATARTESVGPRFEPCLPLRFQRVDDSGLQGPVTQHRNPQWTLLPVRLRDENTLDRAGLPRRTLTVNLHRQSRLGRRGQRALPVNTRRQAPCIALRNPPHADKRVGARAEHQLLQVSDPLEVPNLRRREDPLAQTPYVILSGAPVHSVPLEHNVLRSVHHDGAPKALAARCIAMVPNLSFGSGVTVIVAPQTHPTHVSALAGPGITRIRPVIRDDRWKTDHSAPVPVAFQQPAFASWAVLRPLGISASLTVGLPDRNRSGPQRGYHVPLARDTTGQGAPSTPGTAVFKRPDRCLRPPPAASQRPVPTPRHCNHHPGLILTRRRQGFNYVHPSAFSSPVVPGWNGHPWA